jgi:O-antigen/teichoic acid export membrane protein
MQREGTNVLSHAAVYLAARGLPGLIAFLAIPLFSRLLDPAGYGRYALVLATVNVLNALLFQWLRLSLVRYLPASAGNPARLKSTLMTTGGVLILASGLVATAACLLPVTRGWRDFLAVCAAVLAVQATFDLCCEYARGMLRPWHFMKMQVARSACFVLLGVAFVAAGAGWWGPLAGVAAGMVIAIALTWRRDWADVRPTLDRPMLAALARYGIPLSLTVALTVVIATSDRYLIAWLMGEDAAGLYSVAADFTGQTITLLMTAIHLAMFPVAVRAWESGGAGAAVERMRSNASLLLAVGVPCVVGLVILAPGIAHCFLGKSFRGAAAGIIPLVALGTFVAGMKAYHFDAAFQFAHRTLWQVWIVLFAAVLNVLLNLLAIPRWGINGAAGASVIAYAAAIGLTAWLGRRHVALPLPVCACARVLLAGGAMGLLLYPVRQHTGPAAVAAQVTGGALVYAAVLFASDFIGIRTQFFARRRRAAGAAQQDAREMNGAGVARLAPAVSEVG